MPITKQISDHIAEVVIDIPPVNAPSPTTAIVSSRAVST